MKTDMDIRKNILDEIRWDPQLSQVASEIGVSVKDEVVTLSGTVNHFFQRVAAENAAKRVAAVKVVALDIEVKGDDRTREINDTVIAGAIRHALTWHSAVNEDLINITVDDGWVYLEGTVSFDYERKAAQNTIEKILGVKGVVNNVKIKTKVVEPAEIKRSIRAAFHRHASVDSSNISVDVTGNKVTLTGMVSSWAERKDAEDVAWSNAGVTEVENQLGINSESYAGE